MNEIERIFARRIKERGLSPEKTAKMAGLGTVTVYRFIRGEGNPSLSTLQAMLGVVGLRLGVSDALEAAPNTPTEHGEVNHGNG